MEIVWRMTLFIKISWQNYYGDRLELKIVWKVVHLRRFHGNISIKIV